MSFSNWIPIFTMKEYGVLTLQMTFLFSIWDLYIKFLAGLEHYVSVESLAFVARFFFPHHQRGGTNRHLPDHVCSGTIFGTRADMS